MRRWARCVTLAAICGFSTPPSAAQSVDRNEIIRQARQSYCSLKSEGLTEFGCQVQVDWNSFYKSAGIQLDALAKNQLLPILEKTYFQILVGSSGVPTVSHQSQVAPPNGEVAKRFSQTTAGIEAVLTGAIQIWAMFMISPPLPYANSDYQLENQGDKYRLTYDVGSSHFVISMAHDFAIDEVRVNEPNLEATLHPTFARLKDGFVLVGYKYEQNSKGQSGNPQQFSVNIEYREMRGLELPSTVNVVEPLASAKLETHLMFTDCQAKMMSPKSVIEEPTSAVPARSDTGDSRGDYVVGPGGSARELGNLEVLSDTQGVDFGPYLSRVLDAVRRNWFKLIPEEARAPLMKKGGVSIEFVIRTDGKIAGMKLTRPSGDVSLDRAAQAGITASVPFAPLPNEFHGPSLALRFNFFYNPDKSER
jgi:TonB family protein